MYNIMLFCIYILVSYILRNYYQGSNFFASDDLAFNKLKILLSFKLTIIRGIHIWIRVD
jgi:hypothetical protein